MISPTCDRMRLGGTVSGSTISGGTSIQNDSLFVITLSGLLGHPGRRGGNVGVPFLDGQLRRSGKRSLPRQIILTVEVMDRDQFGLIPTTRGEQWEENMDLLMALVDGEGETVILERDMSDGTTRYLECEALQPWPFTDGLRTRDHVSYIAAIPLECPHPYWQSEQEFSKALTGAFIPPGTATLFNHAWSVSGAGTIHHEQTGADVTVSAGTFPVLIDFGKRTVKVNTADASNRVTFNKAEWLRFKSGVTQTFTGSLGGTQTYRSQFL